MKERRKNTTHIWQSQSSSHLHSRMKTKFVFVFKLPEGQLIENFLF
jgi:hypothetical protein